MQQTITPLDSARDAAGSAARRFVELLYRSEAPSFPGLGAPGHVRIMSGHADRHFYEIAEEPLRQVHKENGTRISVIAGPILSVDDNYDSPLLRLAREGVIDLYFSSCRERHHYRILGRQVGGMPAMQMEQHHLPTDADRNVKEIDAANLYTVATYIADFDRTAGIISGRKTTQGHAWVAGRGEDFIRLRDGDMDRLIWPDEYDFLHPDQLRNLSAGRLFSI